MHRRKFLKAAPGGLAAVAGSIAAAPGTAQGDALPAKPRDFKKEPFRRMVILGESTVEGGPWLQNPGDRYADVLVRLINACQERPMEYFNKGIGANAISPRSPGYEKSRKPSALERYKTDVIDLKPDLFILCYGLNDMRANMPIPDFREDMTTIIRDVQKACSPMTVLTTVYYMTGWKSWPPYDKGSEQLTVQYNECIRSLAEKFQCVLADVWASEGGADWLINPDGVHANKVGNLLIAHRIFEAIAQHASGLTSPTLAWELQTKWAKRAIQSRADSGDPFLKTW